MPSQPLKTSVKFVRVPVQVKTRYCVSGFHWSTLEFSQMFTSVFIRLWMPGENVLQGCHGPWKSWEVLELEKKFQVLESPWYWVVVLENSAHFISKNSKNMLLVQIFWYGTAVKQKPRLRKAWFWSKSDLSLVVFHFQDQPFQESPIIKFLLKNV